MRLYDELADWWHLLSAPEEYAQETAVFEQMLSGSRTVLELGSGWGNNASHLERRFALTSVEPSPGVRAASARLNAECEHVAGGMRSVRPDRRFNAVFVHDALMSMTTEADLRAELATAFFHCPPGGRVLLAPDRERETWRPATDCGGHDGEGRSMRYLEWSYDPDPGDTRTTSAYAFQLRDGDGPPRLERDEHELGLLPRATWIAALRDVGFDELLVVPEAWERELFLCRRPILDVR